MEGLDYGDIGLGSFFDGDIPGGDLDRSSPSESLEALASLDKLGIALADRNLPSPLGETWHHGLQLLPDDPHDFSPAVLECGRFEDCPRGPSPASASSSGSCSRDPADGSSAPGPSNHSGEPGSAAWQHASPSSSLTAAHVPRVTDTEARARRLTRTAQLMAKRRLPGATTAADAPVPSSALSVSTPSSSPPAEADSRDSPTSCSETPERRTSKRRRMGAVPCGDAGLPPRAPRSPTHPRGPDPVESGHRSPATHACDAMGPLSAPPAPVSGQAAPAMLVAPPLPPPLAAAAAAAAMPGPMPAPPVPCVAPLGGGQPAPSGMAPCPAPDVGVGTGHPPQDALEAEAAAAGIVIPAGRTAEEKRQRRMIRNRLSAQLHRRKQRLRVEELEARSAALEATLSPLREAAQRASSDVQQAMHHLQSLDPTQTPPAVQHAASALSSAAHALSLGLAGQSPTPVGAGMGTEAGVGVGALAATAAVGAQAATTVVAAPAGTVLVQVDGVTYAVDPAMLAWQTQSEAQPQLQVQAAQVMPPRPQPQPQSQPQPRPPTLGRGIATSGTAIGSVVLFAAVLAFALAPPSAGPAPGLGAGWRWRGWQDGASAGVQATLQAHAWGTVGTGSVPGRRLLALADPSAADASAPDIEAESVAASRGVGAAPAAVDEPPGLPRNAAAAADPRLVGLATSAEVLRRALALSRGGDAPGSGALLAWDAGFADGSEAVVVPPSARVPLALPLPRSAVEALAAAAVSSSSSSSSSSASAEDVGVKASSPAIASGETKAWPPSPRPAPDAPALRRRRAAQEGAGGGWRRHPAPGAGAAGEDEEGEVGSGELGGPGGAVEGGALALVRNATELVREALARVPVLGAGAGMGAGVGGDASRGPAVLAGGAGVWLGPAVPPQAQAQAQGQSQGVRSSTERGDGGDGNPDAPAGPLVVWGRRRGDEAAAGGAQVRPASGGVGSGGPSASAVASPVVALAVEMYRAKLLDSLRARAATSARDLAHAHATLLAAAADAYEAAAALAGGGGGGGGGEDVHGAAASTRWYARQVVVSGNGSGGGGGGGGGDGAAGDSNASRGAGGSAGFVLCPTAVGSLPSAGAGALGLAWQHAGSGAVQHYSAPHSSAGEAVAGVGERRVAGGGGTDSAVGAGGGADVVGARLLPSPQSAHPADGAERAASSDGANATAPLGERPLGDGPLGAAAPHYLLLTVPASSVDPGPAGGAGGWVEIGCQMLSARRVPAIEVGA